MSKANFYRIPVKVTKTYPPRHRPSLIALKDVRPTLGARDAGERRPTYHPAPQFRRNRRFWLRRIAFAKLSEPA